MMKRGRWLFWGVSLLLAVGVMVVAFRPDSVWVDVDRVKRAPLTLSVEEEGKTRVEDRYLISAPVAGYLHRIQYAIGDPLEAGDVLAELEPLPSTTLDARSLAEARARVAAAESALNAVSEEVEAAEADARLAQEEFQRLERLNTKGFISRESLDKARTRLDRSRAMARSARFRAEVAQYELEAARTQLEISAARDEGRQELELVKVRSPVAGMVLDVSRESEGAVPLGTPLLEVGDPQALEVIVDVLSREAVRLESGIPVRIRGWGGGALEGRVKRVEPVGYEDVSALGVKEQRVWVVVALTSPRTEWASLGDGYRVTAEFILWTAEDVLQVPSSAVFPTEQGHAVFVVEDDHAYRRPVQMGRSDGLSTQINAGLEEGEVVVRHPDHNLEEGVRVRSRW